MYKEKKMGRNKVFVMVNSYENVLVVYFLDSKFKMQNI